MNIFEYQDFKEILNDYLEERAQASSHFSIRGFTQKAGIKSIGFYREVIQGKRKFSATTLEKTLRVTDWSDSQKEYFQALVWYQQSDDPKIKDKYFAEVFRIKQSQIDTSLQPDQFEFYSHWLHAIVRECLMFISLPQDLPLDKVYSYCADYMTSKFLVQVERPILIKSIQLLIEQNIVQRTPGGFIQTDKILSAPKEYFNQQIKYFQAQMLHKAMEVLPLGVEHPKMNSSTTLTLSDENFEKAKDEIRKLKKNLFNLCESNEPQRVFQLNTNLFALTQELNQGGK